MSVVYKVNRANQLQRMGKVSYRVRVLVKVVTQTVERSHLGKVNGPAACRSGVPGVMPYKRVPYEE